MAVLPVQDGTIPFRIASIDIPCSTYYKIVGDLHCGKPALVIMHGGPGAGHEYLLPLGNIWLSYGLPVVFYDSIGCGSSTHLPQTVGDASIWQESLYFAELDNILDHFKLREGPGFHLLGQSWGGMMAVTFAASHPVGLKKLIIASGLASMELSRESMRIRRSEMPSEIQVVFDKAEESHNYESAEFKDALIEFYKNFFYRGQPFPPEELVPALKHMAEDHTVATSCCGASPLVTEPGTMNDWTSISRLPQIDIPTLVYNGEYDTSHDIAQIPFFEKIPRVRWITFPNAGHMCHLEVGGIREKVIKVVGEFLTS